MGYLIDTDVIIYSLKNDPAVRKWMYDNRAIPKFISVVTFGELIYGAKKSHHAIKNTAIVNRVTEFFPVLDITRGIMELYGEAKAMLEQAGNRIDDMDLLIAATSLYMNLPLVTNNRKHFGRIDGLILENWKS